MLIIAMNSSNDGIKPAHFARKLRLLSFIGEARDQKLIAFPNVKYSFCIKGLKHAKPLESSI